MARACHLQLRAESVTGSIDIDHDLPISPGTSRVHRSRPFFLLKNGAGISWGGRVGEQYRYDSIRSVGTLGGTFWSQESFQAARSSRSWRSRRLIGIVFHRVDHSRAIGLERSFLHFILMISGRCKRNSIGASTTAIQQVQTGKARILGASA
jgi:hypothetical protein